MSEQFQPGVMVEVIRETGEAPLKVLAAREIHTVAQFYPSVLDEAGSPDGSGLELLGLEHPRVCYPAEDFRVVYRPRPDLIERLTAEPVVMPPARKPARVNEDA